MARSIALAGIAVALITSCGKSTKRPPTLAEAAVEINALIPEKWKGKIELVPGSIVYKDWKYSLLLPKGWPESQIYGAVEPPDNNVVDFSPTFGYNNEVAMRPLCGGDCGGVKEWKAASDKQMFRQFTTGLIRGSVLTDKELPDGRLFIYQRSPEKGSDVKVVPGDKARLIIRAWWNVKEDRYHTCHVTLSDLSYELAPVMAAACMTATAERVPAAPAAPASDKDPAPAAAPEPAKS
jgi:hypothetical protein